MKIHQHKTRFISIHPPHRRLPEGGDSQLDSQYNCAVSIHSSASTGSFDPQLTFLLATLPAGASWAHNESGLIVK